MTKLLLFDGNALMHRAYHALPSMTTPLGKPVNAVYGLTSMLLRVIVDLAPTHIAFTFDRREPTFRRELVPSYQAHRPEMDEDLGIQFAIAKDIIKAFGIPIYEKAGFEADDVIGTIARRVEGLKPKAKSRKAVNSKRSTVNSIIIVTGDRDILQLVNDKISLFMPATGLSNGKPYGEREAEERMGVPPKQVVDFKALVGDPSDNYKGVPGIGPKTAIKLLSEYKTLDGVYANLGELSQRTKTLLQKNKDSAYVSQKLATIVCDVDIDFKLTDMNKWQVDGKEVLDAFAKVGFKTLGERVKKVGKEISTKKQMVLV